MAGYGDETEIKRQLGLVDADPDDAGAIARVVALNASLSRVFDHECGRRGTATEARTVEAANPAWGGWFFTPSGYWPPITDWTPFPNRLVLPWPLVSVTGIEEGGTWDGATWDDGTAVASTDYRLVDPDQNGGYRAIERLIGNAWSGPVRITGTWVNAGFTAPPVEVIDALTFLVVSHYREENASPAGVVGPDGMQVPTRNPWSYRRVAAVIERYRVYELVV